MTDKPTESEALAARLDTLEARIEARFDAVEKASHDNTQATLEGNRDAREMLEIFQAVRGGFRVLGWIGTVARWLAGLGGAAAAIYGAWYAFSHGGQLPPRS